MEGGEEFPFAEMHRLQARVESVIRKDPDVTGVVSVIGVTPINATPNAGRLAITLRSRDERKASVRRSSNACSGRSPWCPARSCISNRCRISRFSTRVSRAQYQYTLSGTDADEVGNWAAKLARQLQSSPFLRDVASEAQDNGFQLRVQVDRERRKQALGWA